MGWSELLSFIQSELEYEGNTITEADALPPSNEAVDRIAEIVRPRPASWLASALTSDALGYRLPQEMIGPLDSVTYDGEEIRYCPPRDYERYVNGSYTIDEPVVWCVVGVYFRTNASSLTLVNLNGYAALPHYEAVETPPDPEAPDPMSYLPQRFALLPAYYVLMNFRAGADVAPEMARVQKYAAEWQGGLVAATEAVARLGSQPFRF